PALATAIAQTCVHLLPLCLFADTYQTRFLTQCSRPGCRTCAMGRKKGLSLRPGYRSAKYHGPANFSLPAPQVGARTDLPVTPHPQPPAGFATSPLVEREGERYGVGARVSMSVPAFWRGAPVPPRTTGNPRPLFREVRDHGQGPHLDRHLGVHLQPGSPD